MSTELSKLFNCKLGFQNSSKKFSEEEMIGLAVLNGCRAITRIGENGRWYLKGRDIAIDTIKQEIKENTGKYENGTYVLLLEE